MRLRPPLLLILSISACSRSGAPAKANEWRAERDTVGDTVVVRTVSGSVWGDSMRLVQRMSIGVADGDENQMLGDIRSLAIARDGSVYLMDGQTALKKFGPDGTYLKTFGRVGSGPGEYRRPDGGLAVLPDGRVVLRDPGNGRMAVFTADGDPLPTWRISSSLNTSRKLYRDGIGNVYTLILWGPDASDPDDWILGLWRFDSAGVARDSIQVPQWRYQPAILKAQRDGNTSTNNVPFTPESHWTFNPQGYLVGGVSNAYRIDLFKPGAPLRIERSTAPVLVQDQEAADYKRARTESFQHDYPGWVWNGPSIPGTKPVFQDVFAGEDGRIWVHLYQKGVIDSAATRPETGTPRDAFQLAWTERVVFDVFEPDGRYLGAVATPRGFLTDPEPVFRGDTVWAAVEDDDGVRYVRRFEFAQEKTNK